MSLQGIKKIIKPHWNAGAVFNIQFALGGSSGSRYPVSVSYNANEKVLYVTYSDDSIEGYALSLSRKTSFPIICGPGIVDFVDAQTKSYEEDGYSVEFDYYTSN